MTRAAIVIAATLAFHACGAARAVTIPPTAAVATPPRNPIQSLQADLAAIFEGPQFDRSFWSVLVRPAASSDVDLYSLNATKLMMPASTMKLVTLAAAAEVLGWDHHFETRIVTTAPVEGGSVRGDLVVIGGGDPGISERSDAPGVLTGLARSIRDAGITRVEGGIIGDDDLFDDAGFGDGWTLDNLPYGYSAPISALEYNEGSVDLVIRAGASQGDPVVIQVRPDGSGLVVDNRLVTVSESGTGRLTLRRLPGSSRVIVEGQIPAKSASFARTASVDNPTLFFVSALRAALVGAGVQVDGDAADIDDFPDKPGISGARTIASHTSPPLRQLASAMMRVSQNQYAEMLSKALGGRAKVRELLNAWNIADDSYILADGSGLSRYNYVSADMLVRVLARMHAEPRHAAAFSGTLPIGGRDGPLSRRMDGTPAEGRVRAKTGSADNIRAIAGYVDTIGGETLIFSMIANNFTASTSVIDTAADTALARLATFTRQP